MKNIFKLATVAALATTLVLGGSCTSKFEEINTDPDALETGSPTNMLAYVLRYTAAQHGAIDAVDEWAGYITKIQYPDNYNYIPTNNTYGNKFLCNYGCQEQINDLLALTESSAEGNKNIRWAARIWSEFLWLWTTDQFGDIPYSEANQVDEGLMTPVYDDQSTIYPSILADLKTIADEMATEDPGTEPIGDGDFLFGGDITLWQKFCNSLRMRAAMRIVNVAPELAQSTIEEICQNPGAYPLLETNDENAYFYWQGSAPYFEPYYDNFRTRDEHGMSNIFVAHMTQMQDPRISSMMKPAVSDGQYRGYENGALAAAPQIDNISRIGAMYREDPAGFTPFLKSCENYFIKAEAALRGWNVGTTAEAAYTEAVRLSMEENGVSDADMEAYLNGSGKWDGTFERLYMEEWVALFKENLEAWSLYRRTGYPQEIITSGEYPGAFCVFGSAHNDVPFRMPYPNNEYLYNKENVEAAAANIVDNTWGEQMWWDTRTGVH